MKHKAAMPLTIHRKNTLPPDHTAVYYQQSFREITKAITAGETTIPTPNPPVAEANPRKIDVDVIMALMNSSTDAVKWTSYTNVQDPERPRHVLLDTGATTGFAQLEEAKALGLHVMMQSHRISIRAYFRRLFRELRIFTRPGNRFPGIELPPGACGPTEIQEEFTAAMREELATLNPTQRERWENYTRKNGNPIGGIAFAEVKNTPAGDDC